MSPKAFLAAAVASSLAACGGGGGGGGGGSDSDLAPQLEVLASFADAAESDLRAAQPGELTGRARMTGVFGVLLDGPDEFTDKVVLGDAQALFNFERTSISGTVTNFNEFTGLSDAESPEVADFTSAYEGELRMRRGVVTGDSFQLDLEGQLSGNSDFGRARGREAFVADVSATTRTTGDAGAIAARRSDGGLVASAEFDVTTDITLSDTSTIRSFDEGVIVLQE